jgi:hypothetical protein
MRLHGLIVVRASLSQAGLRLPANAMAPGVRYTFELRMAAAGHPQEAAASVTVDAACAPAELRIAGGSRSVRVGEHIVLDAAAALGGAVGLDLGAVAWGCAVAQDVRHFATRSQYALW